ncbi:hypothetical protein AAF712_010390 [Marasmius tenuissimus]|uniref:Transposase n=1 Tax=Marasmius tenuissimus TaxID=585030 RepID=A0ABR2ZN00_9AGAR
MPLSILACEFCGNSGWTKSSSLNKHIVSTASCRAKAEQRQQALVLASVVGSTQPQVPNPHLWNDSDVNHGADSDDDVVMTGTDSSVSATTVTSESPLETLTNVVDLNDVDAEPPRRVRIEDVADEDEQPHTCFMESYPGASGLVYPGDRGRTRFEQIRDDQILKGEEILGPFQDSDEWEFAKWCIKNVGHNATDELLRMPMISNCAKPSFGNKADFLAAIDSLPSGVPWKLEEVTVTGDRQDDEGKGLTERMELWYRDPIECVRELLGNPMFREVTKYSPERLFEDREGLNQTINEMWTGSWWWDRQEKVPSGSTIAPIILSSDKTQLSQFRGDKSAWPVYLTIDNISKDVRREASSHATVLIGYIPVGKFDCYTDNAKQFARYRLFHHCMGVIIQSVADAEEKGLPMTCSDGFIRHIIPILAAYVADYPEQCLVGCCMENRCPLCLVDPNSRGSGQSFPPRTTRATLSMIQQKFTNLAEGKTDSPEFQAMWGASGIRYVPQPFWSKLKYGDILQGFTPDLLHQLHKGVFKDHLVKWCMVVIGSKELDERFRAMTDSPGLRHFKNGISTVKQWTGTEHKAMEAVFVGLMADACADVRVLRTVKAVIDFIYYSSLHTHTTRTLETLSQALNTFHDNKDVFIELEARTPAHFNIPKIHAMQHYVDLIRSFGSADGFNTESPERLHIDYAKDAYRASNKKDYIIQMTRWLQRQEAVDRFTGFLKWCRDGCYRPAEPEAVEQVDADDVEAEDDDETPLDAAVLRQLARTVPSPRVISHIKYADTAPKPLRNVEAQRIIRDHNATGFLPALTQFLRQHDCLLIPNEYDRFNLYKRVTTRLPLIPYAGKNNLLNVIRSTPPVPAYGRHEAQLPHLDFVLVRTGEQNIHTDGTVLKGAQFTPSQSQSPLIPILSGLRVALVRAIFDLPAHFAVPSWTRQPLAYIEWFTPFGRLDADSGMYILSKSTRQRRLYSEIVRVNRIVRNCHLTPKFGRQKDHS